MDSKGAAPNQVYEDFVPTTELVQEENSDTLLLDLTGDLLLLFFSIDGMSCRLLIYIVFRVIFAYVC